MAAAALLLVLLLGSMIGLARDAWRKRKNPEYRSSLLERALLWTASGVGLAWIVSTGIAVWIGGNQSPLVPAIGVPTSFGWILGLPWVLLGLIIIIVALMGRFRRTESRPPALLRISILASGIMLIAAWALVSNGAA